MLGKKSTIFSKSRLETKSIMNLFKKSKRSEKDDSSIEQKGSWSKMRMNETTI